MLMALIALLGRSAIAQGTFLFQDYHKPDYTAGGPLGGRFVGSDFSVSFWWGLQGSLESDLVYLEGSTTSYVDLTTGDPTTGSGLFGAGLLVVPGAFPGEWITAQVRWKGPLGFAATGSPFDIMVVLGGIPPAPTPSQTLVYTIPEPASGILLAFTGASWLVFRRVRTC